MSGDNSDSATMLEEVRSHAIQLTSSHICVDEKLFSLSRIHCAVTRATVEEMREITSLCFNALIDCMNVQVLRFHFMIFLPKLFASFGPGVLVEAYSTQLLKCLSFPYGDITSLVLQEIIQVKDDRSLMSRMVGNETFVYLLTCLVIHEDDVTSALAVNVLIELGKTFDGPAVITSPRIVDNIRNMMARDYERNVLRFIKVLIGIIGNSEIRFQTIINGINILQELQNTGKAIISPEAMDYMIQIVKLERGYAYLESNGMLVAWEQVLVNARLLDYKIPTVPGITKLFGTIGQRKPVEIFTKYPEAIDCIFHIARLKNCDMRAISMDAVLMFALSGDGMRVISQNHETEIQEIIVGVGQKVEHYAGYQLARILDWFASLLRINIGERYTADLMALTYNWYSYLCRYPTKELLYLSVSGPIPVMQSALGIFETIAGFEWAQHSFNTNPGLMDYLLNRENPHYSVIKELKRKIVRKLAHSPTSSQVFGPNMMARIQKALSD